MSTPACSNSRHIVLVGMMGVGKSSVGRALSASLGRPLHDTDALVERATGRTVRQIWVEDGEDAFRDQETAALAGALAAEEPAVIAAAGGAVLRAENRSALRGPGCHVVWLCADVGVLVERVNNGMHRPALDDDPEAALIAMADSRSALYREVADAVVSVDHRSVSEVAQAVLRCYR